VGSLARRVLAASALDAPVESDPRHRHRLRPDRHRPGRRVRLLRHAGLQGAARGGLRGHPGQLQPGDDHDRPGVRRRTYIEPITPEFVTKDHREGAARRVLPTLGGQTALNAAMALHERGVLEKYGVELIGANARDPMAEDRQEFKEAMRAHRAARRPQRRSRHTWTRRSRSPSWTRLPGDHPPVVHLGGSAAASPTTARSEAIAGRGLDRSPDHRGAHRGVDPRLEGVRARGDARPRRQRRDRLLDREPRPDGRAHRRLDHRRAGDDAHRPRVPADARHRDRIIRAVGVDTGGCNIQFAVNPATADGRHRDEPARVALVGAGVQGDRLPDRQDRRQAGRRLHARRDPNDITRETPASLRADARLRRGEVPALRLREVPGADPS
jgi:carbamoyl-phosphate synthase large subunit